MNKKIISLFLMAVSLLFVSGCNTTGSVQELSITERLYQERKPEMEAAKEAGAPILMTSLFTNDPNSAGGVNVRTWYYVLASQSNPIKYIDFEVVPYNGVDDLVTSTVGDRKVKRSLRVTGPLVEKEGEHLPEVWKNVWYNNSIECTQLNSISIEMMNGEVHTYNNDFSEIMSEQLINMKPCGGLPRYQSPQI
jgi:hypothetical protein